MKRLILVALIILAPIFLIGSVGAFEAENIGFGQCFIQSIVAIAVEYLAIKALSR